MALSPSNPQRVRILWDDTTTPPRYPALNGDIEVDVAVIGAGITGLTTAWHLLQAGQRVAVLDSYQVGSGTTGSSTGNLYVPVGPRLAEIEAKHGVDTLRIVAGARAAAIDFIEQRVREYGIECDFRRVPFHLFTRSDGEAMDEVHKEFEAARRAGLHAQALVPAGFPFKAAEMLTLENQAQFNPRRYCVGLAAAISGPNCRIYEDTHVVESDNGEPCTLVTASGRVTAQYVVKATHSPVGFYAVHAAMKPCREFAVAGRLPGAPPPEGIYWNISPGTHYSIRPVRMGGADYIMVLGRAHTPGEQKDEDVRKLAEFLRARFSVTELSYVWAAQNYQPADLLPYIGTSPLERHTFIATGFAADGLVWGTLAAQLISDAISGRDNPWADTFNPKRFTPAASAKNFVEETVETASHLIRDYLHREKQEIDAIAPGDGKVLKIDGKRVAVSRDAQGQIQCVSAACTHLGCIVHWNGLEKSWDCPCHGSRFSPQGAVLEGPAMRNLKPLG